MRLPWLKAPRAGLASPVTVVVGVVTGLVLAFVVAATAFYVSAAGSAAARYAVAHRCETDNGLRFGRANGELDRDQAAVRAAAAAHGADRVLGTRVYLAPDRPGRLHLVHRDGAFDEVTVVSGGDRTGVWLPDHFAESRKLGPGDTLVVMGEPVRVGAVYRRPADPVPPYWCTNRELMVSMPLAGVNGLPPTLLAPPEVLDRLSAAGLLVPRSAGLEVATTRPLRTTADAERWAGATAAIQRAVGVDAVVMDNAVTDNAAAIARTASRTQDSVRDAVLPLTAISVLAGLLGVVGLAAQWSQRRAAEVRLLWTRGVPPAAIGGKAVLELGMPLLAGACLGWLAARVTVPAFAPAADLDPWASWAAVALAATAWVVALAVLAVSASMRVRRQFSSVEREPHRIAVVVRRIPWELLAVGGAVAAFVAMPANAVLVDPSDLLPEVSTVALAFPLLCMAALVGLIARVAAVLSRASHHLRDWRRPTVLWALRRTAAQRKVAVALLAVAGLAIGVIAAGSGVARTEREALTDKSWVRVGSDNAIRLVRSAGEAEGVPAQVRGTATRIASTKMFLTGNATAQFMLVDPATFAHGARWRDQWAGRDLTDLLGTLERPGADGTIPVIVVGNRPLGDFIGEYPLLKRMRVVATVPVFPGTGQFEGSIVTSWRWVTPDERRGYNQQILTKGDPAPVVAAMRAAGESTGAVSTAAGSLEALPFLVIGWIFAFFVVLGFALAAVAVVTLLVSVETRRRSTAVAHALLARMGLRARALLTTHLVELALLAGTAVAVGVGGGWLILRLTVHRLDPFPLATPVSQPASLLAVGLLTAAVALVGVVLVAVYAVRSARRAGVRELLRV